jgi:hypothetical protein
MAVAGRMKQTNKVALAALLLALVLSIGVVGQNERTLLLIVNGTGDVWPDCGLRERLVSSLGDRSGLLLASPDDRRIRPPSCGSI